MAKKKKDFAILSCAIQSCFDIFNEIETKTDDPSKTDRQTSYLFD